MRERVLETWPNIQKIVFVKSKSCILCRIHIHLQRFTCVVYSATHCNTLHHTATHCNSLQQNATRCNTRQHTATHRDLMTLLEFEFLIFKGQFHFVEFRHLMNQLFFFWKYTKTKEGIYGFTKLCVFINSSNITTWWIHVFVCMTWLVVCFEMTHRYLPISCSTVCCSALQCVVVCCSVSQCVAMWCSCVLHFNVCIRICMWT